MLGTLREAASVQVRCRSGGTQVLGVCGCGREGVRAGEDFLTAGLVRNGCLPLLAEKIVMTAIANVD